MRLLYSIFIILITTTGCDGQSSNNVGADVAFKKFPLTKKVKFNFFMPHKQGVIRKIYVKDSIIIFTNLQSSNKYLFSSYSLTTKQHLKDFVPFGGKFGQVFGGISMGLRQDNLWVFDTASKKLVNINLTTKDSVLSITEHKVKDFYYAAQPTDSLTLYANGNYKLPKKIQKIDLKSKEIITEFGDFINAPSSTPVLAWKKANEGFLFLKPSADKLVTALRYTDEIEIFDLKTGKSKIIKGPEGYPIAYKAYKMPDGSDMTQRIESTQFAFIVGVVNDNYIYLLYSGNKEENINSSYGKQIYVYDWDGNPIKKLSLPHYISCFDIVNDKILYAFDVETMAVVKAEI